MIDAIAHQYLASKGAAVASDFLSTDLANNYTDSSVWDQPRGNWVRGVRVRASAHPTYILPQPEDRTTTVTLIANRLLKRPQTPKSKGVHLAIRELLTSDPAEGITMRMKLDAVTILAKLPEGSPVPKVEFGDEEITFEWRAGELSATASVEGDGHVGYALREAGRYVPGTGPEDLSEPTLPQDLVKYLRRFPAVD